MKEIGLRPNEQNPIQLHVSCFTLVFPECLRFCFGLVGLIVHSNSFNTDTEGAIESVLINGRFNLGKI